MSGIRIVIGLAFLVFLGGRRPVRERGVQRSMEPRGNGERMGRRLEVSQQLHRIRLPAYLFGIDRHGMFAGGDQRREIDVGAVLLG